MRRTLFAFALALAPAVLAPVASLAATIVVPMNQAIRVTLAAPAQDVIVGNPAIADVAVADQRHLVITGKGNGVTNVIVTDARGRDIFDRQLLVSPGAADGVNLISGNDITSYACAPQCKTAGAGAGAGGSWTDEYSDAMGRMMKDMTQQIGQGAANAGAAAANGVAPGTNVPAATH